MSYRFTLIHHPPIGINGEDIHPEALDPRIGEVLGRILCDAGEGVLHKALVFPREVVVPILVPAGPHEDHRPGRISHQIAASLLLPFLHISQADLIAVPILHPGPHIHDDALAMELVDGDLIKSPEP